MRQRKAFLQFGPKSYGVSRTVPSSKPQAVFIVEDDRAVRDALTLLVEDQGIAIAAFADGESFLQNARPSDGDIVLLDLGLPDMDGELVAELLRIRGCKCRIAVISGQRGAAFDRSVARVRPFAAFRKPLHIPSLLQTLSLGPARA
ncbi:MAG: response regulator [Pseudomonadota bacterium]